MVHSGLKGCNIVVVGSYKDDYTPEKVKKWVAEASGKISFQSRIANDTTHLVVSEKEWKKQGAVVRDARERKERGQKIHIVAFAWLEASLYGKSKRAENAHSWFKKARSSTASSKSLLEPRSTKGLMSQVFTESTESFLTDATKQKIMKQRMAEEEARKEKAEREKQEFEKELEAKSLKQLVRLFERGVRKDRNELLTKDYHIYVDGMGFTYDVTLEPTQQNDGPDEHFTLQLQIYESKAEPHTYAFNTKFSGTKTRHQANIIVCIGCNFPSAFRCLKKVFEEETGDVWASGDGKPGAAFKYVIPADGLVAMSIEDEEPRQKSKSRNRSSEQKPLGSNMSDRPTADTEFECMEVDETMSGQDGSVLGKRKESGAPLPTGRTEGKLPKIDDFSSDMSQYMGQFDGEGYAFGLPDGGATEMFPRFMGDFQAADDQQQENQSYPFFDFSIG